MIRVLMFALIPITLLWVPAEAGFGIDPVLSNVTGPSFPVTVVITPAGNGDVLEDLGATLTVVVLDLNGSPVVGLPRQDVWIDDPGDGSLRMCAGGAIADHDTDATGATTFTGALAGGGYSNEIRVFVSGLMLVGAPVAVQIISPDYDASRRVDLSDVGEFALDWSAGVAGRSDFVADGFLNLADVGRFASAYGEVCGP